MQTRIEITNDGSHTLFVTELNEHYHSTFGAVQESMVVFIQSGLNYLDHIRTPLQILEMGFGTGLNAFLTCLECEKFSRQINYTGVEKFPLSKGITDLLNYPGFIDPSTQSVFRLIHKAPWNQETNITGNFMLHKIDKDIRDILPENDTYDLVYFDAFGPDVQPELWTEEVFQKVALSMKKGGILVTYSVKGSVRRALKNSGFEVEKIPGPPGKREIARATKK